MRYINSVIDLQKKMGHRVIFVTDAKPTQTINADNILYHNDVSTYVPNMRDGHVWLQIDATISDGVKYALQKLSVEPDLVVAHDLHSYLGAIKEFNNGVFVQHESDVMMQDQRCSFLDDDYLQTQIDVVNTTNWRVGMSVMSRDVSPRRPVYTPVPFSPVASVPGGRTRGLLYIGDSTDRKGAREFMAMAQSLKATPTVITHDPDADLFKGADVYSFGLDQQAAMYHLMDECNVAYISSKNECWSVAVLECLQFMPVVVNNSYRWTSYLQDIGVHAVDSENIQMVLEHFLLAQSNENRLLLDIWSRNSQQFWRNLST